MNWIRKTILFVSLLIIGLFAAQVNELPVQKTESQKTDTNFSKQTADSSAFIQPQASYHFAANIKTDHTASIKWFDSLLIVIPQYKIIKTAFNFTNPFPAQSKKISLMLYAFHFFW